MLWIQYEAYEKLDLSLLNDMVTRVASLVAPHPVGAFDDSPIGLGLVFHNGVIDPNDDRCNSDEDIDDNEQDSSDVEQSFVPYDIDDRFDISPENNVYMPGMTANSFVLVDSLENITSTTSNSSTGPSGGVRGTTTSSESKNTSNERNSDSREPDGQNTQQQSGDHGNGDSTGPGEGPGGDRQSSSSVTIRSPSQEFEGRYEMFSGVARVLIADSIEQQLYISFGLQITPLQVTKPVDCRVALNNVIIGASKMEDLKEEDGRELEHYFVTKQGWLTVGPRDGQCSAAHSILPRKRYFYNNITDSTNWQVNAGLQISKPPVTGNIIYGKSTQKQLPTAVVEVELIKSGSGRRQDYEWCYRPKSSSTSTHMEFSSTSPPTHTATYTVGRNATTPKTFRVGVKAIYQRQGKLRRLLSTLSARMRFMEDVQLRHFIMELNVTIGNEEDYCRFPTPAKGGCDLIMEVDACKGRIDPAMLEAGVVKSSLVSPRRTHIIK